VAGFTRFILPGERPLLFAGLLRRLPRWRRRTA
jgi:hypothetical protein